MTDKPIFVTKPDLPPLEEFIPLLQGIWESRILTNNGPLHKSLENSLCEHLGVKYISLFSNATIALITALKALDIKGEVITTPYSFVATSHSLLWNNITPVFVDIKYPDCNINSTLIEKAITANTSAIMPVHCYGNPCNLNEIASIAEKYNLKIIYDAAHAFGVKYKGRSILEYGDLSILSFHATKVFNTFEGGAIVSPSLDVKNHIDNLKNFGFVDETNVIEVGINGKMNELSAAIGLVQLKYFNKILQKRSAIDFEYRKLLSEIKGISFSPILSDVESNYSYFPIFVGKDYKLSRDELYFKLKEMNIYGRRYFYPLISNMSMYNQYNKNNSSLSVANEIAKTVICLPMYSDLDLEDVNRIASAIKNIGD